MRIIYKKNSLFIEIINDNVVRVTTDLDYNSYAVVLKQTNKININEINEDNYIIKTKTLIIKLNNNNLDFYDIHENPLSIDGKSIDGKTSDTGFIKLRNLDLKFTEVRKIESDEYFYGLGDKTGYLNKRGYEYINWNTDDPSVQSDNTESLYKSLPFLISHSKSKNYGFFLDNTYKSVFNIGKDISDILVFGAVNGDLNYYFIYGKTMKEVVKNYTILTGRYPLPQLWTLANHQSRWSYASLDQAEDVLNKYRFYNIPCDVIHLDIDYMDNYKIFTTSEERFPEFKKILESFKKKGFKTICIIDPGVKVENEYFMYEEGIKNNYFATLNNKVYENAVWPGKSVFPNFNSQEVRNWWSEKIKEFIKSGIDGIWIDMNEPASFIGPFPDEVEFNNKFGKHYHNEIHNVYGHLMAEATFNGLSETNQRPFIITRACYSGTQRFSSVWTGDNHSIWSHLQMAIPQLCNLNLSGMPFAGTDVGGFSADCTKELMIRWIQVGVFTPLLRNHSAAGTRNQEPWSFDQETIEIYRKYVELRYQLLPYFYDLFKLHEQTGSPVFTPLVYNYGDDEKVFEINDEFMIGNILIAPILEQGKRSRIVYLPKGNWYDYFTKKKYKGGKEYLLSVPLDTLLLFVKENSIIPTYEVKQYVTTYDNLILRIYGNKALYKHYQDDGVSNDYKKGVYNVYLFKYDKDLTIKMIRNNYPVYKNIIYK